MYNTFQICREAWLNEDYSIDLEKASGGTSCVFNRLDLIRYYHTDRHNMPAATLMAWLGHKVLPQERKTYDRMYEPR